MFINSHKAAASASSAVILNPPVTTKLRMSTGDDPTNDQRSTVTDSIAAAMSDTSSPVYLGGKRGSAVPECCKRL